MHLCKVLIINQPHVACIGNISPMMAILGLPWRASNALALAVMHICQGTKKKSTPFCVCSQYWPHDGYFRPT